MIDAGLEVGGVDPYVRSGCDPGHALHIFPTTDEPAAAVGEPTGAPRRKACPYAQATLRAAQHEQHGENTPGKGEQSHSARHGESEHPSVPMRSGFCRPVGTPPQPQAYQCRDYEERCQ